MTLAKLWAGRIFGTNTGNIFAKLETDGNELTGTLHIHEPGVGTVVYTIQGTFDGESISFKGAPRTPPENVVLGDLSGSGKLNTKGELTGEWSTTIGTAGPFVLYPHDANQSNQNASTREQLHTTRVHFGAISVDKDRLIELSEQIQKEFDGAQVVITTTSRTEQSQFLTDFRNSTPQSDRASVAKIFIQQPEPNGINRTVVVEFGPHTNDAMTQSSDEAWALGMREKIKAMVTHFEQAYTTNFKKFGFGINQVLIFSAIVFLPALSDIAQRAIFMAGVLALTFGVNWLHITYLPNAAIYLTKKPESVFARVGPSVLSWLIAATAGIAATLLGAYLQGWLRVAQ